MGHHGTRLKVKPLHIGHRLVDPCDAAGVAYGPLRALLHWQRSSLTGSMITSMTSSSVTTTTAEDAAQADLTNA